MKAHVMTVDEILVDVFNPHPDDLHLHTIAHHLAMQTRYNGAARRFYSVAEHCATAVHLAMIRYDDLDLARAVLLHDAHEAFIGDIITPLKPLLVDSPWWHAADALDLALQHRYDVSFDDSRIKEIDDHMLAIEWNALMPQPDMYADRMCMELPVVGLNCHDPMEAKRLFLATANGVGLT